MSLFDGMSCGQIALERCGIEVDNYVASEIDKYAMQVTKTNYPKTIHIGDVTKVNGCDFQDVDLLIGGSPCQGFSFAGDMLNFNDQRSKLFFEFVRLLEEIKPKYFLLENVKMKKEYEDIITKHIGVSPCKINSNRFSAQNRERLYWTNIPISDLPCMSDTMLIDILDNSVEFNLTDYAVSVDKHKSSSGLICVGGLCKNKKWLENGQNLQLNFSQGERIYSVYGKCPTLSANSGGTAGAGNMLISRDGGKSYRKLTWRECERLQTVPVGYTENAPERQRHKMLGNGWTVDVIAHIFRGLPK